jgi:O-acetyl-ADP-ribose deacetylase (regulator of RNase III)
MNQTQVNYLTGDATKPNGAGTKIIAHVCNDIGRWGKGFVLAISRRWPEPERIFKSASMQGNGLKLGQVQFVSVAHDIVVANMIGQHKIATQYDKASAPPIRYPALAECLSKLADYAHEQNASIHMPRIGCGLAGGKWEMIEPLLDQHLCRSGLVVCVYDFA